MPDADIGPSVARGDVARALCDTLETWVPFYLAQMDVRYGLEAGTTAPPQHYRAASDASRWAEETPPALLVVVPGTVGDPPKRHGPRGSYGATWLARIGVTVAGADQEGADDLADRHMLAVRHTLVQQGSLGGLAESTWWRSERCDVLPQDRSLLACETVAHVRIGRVVDSRGPVPRVAPTDPTDPADPPFPTPVGHQVHVTHRP